MLHPEVRRAAPRASLSALSGPGRLTDALAGLEPGSHISAIYRSPEEWDGAVAAYLAAGLERGDKCLYVLSDHGAAEVRHCLAAAGTDPGPFEASGQLLLLDADDAYLAGAGFHPDEMIALLRQLTRSCLDDGYRALRVVGETAWAERLGQVDSLLEYETRLNAEFFHHWPCIGLCLYDRSKFTPHFLQEVASTHPLLLHQGRLLRNIHYVPADEYVPATAEDRHLDLYLAGVVREQEARERLQESELRYRIVADNTYDWEFWLAPDGACLYSSPSCERLTGYTAAEAEADASLIARMVHPDDAERYLAHVNGEPEGDQEPLEFRIVTRDGRVRWIQHLCRPVHDEAGRYLGVRGSNRDVTERVNAERERQTHTERLQALVRLSAAVVSETTSEGLVRQVVEAARQLTGARIATAGHGYRDGAFTVDAVSRGPDMPACPPGERFTVERGGVYARVMREGIAIRLSDDEMRRQPDWRGLPEGHAPLRGLLGVPLLDTRGAAAGIIMVSDSQQGDFTATDEALLVQLATIASIGLRHIEARREAQRRAEELEVERANLKQALRSLAQSEARYRGIGELIPYGSWACDAEGRLTQVSDSFLELVGMSLEELGGAGLEAIVDEAEREAVVGQFRACFASGSPIDLDYRVRGHDGQPHAILTRGVPVRDGDGRITGWVGINLDIQEREEAAREIEHLAADLEQERDLLQTVMENTGAHLAYLDEDLNFVMVNSAYVEGCGHSEEELIGRNHFDLFPNAENQAIFERVRDTGEPVEFRAKPFEYVDQPERGVTYWDWTLVPVHDSLGKRRGLVFSLVDVTEVMRTQERVELLAAEAQRRAAELEAVFASIPDGIAVYDAVGRIVRANPGVARLMGFTPEDWRLPASRRGKRADAVRADGSPFAPGQLPIERALRGETVTGEIMGVRPRPGERVWVAASTAPIVMGDGEVHGAVAAFTDVSETRRAQERLQEANATLLAQTHQLDEQRLELVALTEALEQERARLSAIIDNAPEGIIVCDNRARIVLANPAADRICALPPLSGEDAIESVLPPLCYPDGTPCAPLQLPLTRSALHAEVHGGVELVVTWPDGQRRDLLMNTAPIVGADGSVGGAVGLVQDVTERRNAERELERLMDLLQDAATDLRVANERLQAQADELRAQKDELLALTRDLDSERERLYVTLRSIGDGVIATDAGGDIVLMNRVAETLTGWPEREAAGLPLSQVFRIVNEKTGEPVDDPVSRVIERNEVVGLANHTALISREGEARIIADSAAPIRDARGQVIGVILVFQDITERRKLEDEMARANKLEALGLLAGGIAHDFNNLLTGIMGNLMLARIEAQGQGELSEMLAEAERASTRAQDLTQQLLTFARGGAPIRRATPLPELLVESCSFVLRGSDVRAQFHLPEGLWPVEADEGQISQVIQNLVINADEAMPNGGMVRLTAENVQLGGQGALPLQPGRYVKLVVADAGVGISPQFLDRIFDPYFTTKQKGSGLGLASAYSIINRHDGLITVESQVGVGTTFTVYLPAALAALPLEVPEDERSISGGGRVLVMDDEAVVQRVVRRMLEHLGYEVEVSSDGGEAIELYEQARALGRPFDVVIMDLTVPGGMGGKEAVLRLREVEPSVRAVVSSGYSNDPVMAEYRRHGFCGVMSKPYRIEELSRTLYRIINSDS